MCATNSIEPPFESMRRLLRTERERTANELAAFETFAERIRDVPTTASTRPAGPAALTDRSQASSLATVREAYRSTVMDVPHYDQEYGNDFTQDVTEEFGSTITTILLKNGSLDARTKQVILTLAAESCTRRQGHLDLLDAEEASIETAATRINPIVQELTTFEDRDFCAESFGALDGYRARTEVLLDKCDKAAERRQKILHDHRTADVLSGTVAAVPFYLYQELETTFPLLSFIADLGEYIESVQRDIGRAVSRYEVEYPSSGFETDTRGRTES
jgi:hypothetical protein